MTETLLAAHGGAPSIDASHPFPVWPQTGPGDLEAMKRVLESGAWGSNAGEEVQTFQRTFADMQSARHGIAVVNGTMAIVAALEAVGVGFGDEVIVPSYTFIATAAAPLMVGALPVFADVTPTGRLIDPESVRARVTPRTKAIIAVHLAGAPADLAALREICDEHAIALIEDAAQAAGAEFRGTDVGAIGDVGTFSFQGTKNLTAGEGGIMLTNRDDVAERLYSYVNVGRVPGGGWYDHRSFGFNLRLTEFQGALLSSQLSRFEELQAHRQRIALALDAGFTDMAGVEVVPADENTTRHGRHCYLMRVPELGAAGLRDAAVDALRAEGVIGAFSGYVPLHRSAALKERAAKVAKAADVTWQAAECPTTDLVCSDTIWLDQRTLLGDERHVEGVVEAFRKVLGQRSALRAIADASRQVI